MLKGNIVLPEYQRSFVWDEKDIKRLIKSFNDGQFVQPITIAQYKTENTVQNLILDGQQRLTSILLYYLGYFPNKDKFNVLEESVITSDDPTDDETTNDKANDKKIIGWTFEDLLKNTTNTIETIKEKLKDDNRYSEITKDKDKDIILDDNFLDNHFLGFSYIIPNCNTCDEINSYYSTLFRKINYYGVSLTNLECRRSLYYMNSEIKNYFEGKTDDNKNILCDIKIPGNNTNIEIIRYLSNLSLYYTLEKSNEANGFKFNKEEEFYTDYVFHVLGQETEDYDFKKFNFETILKNNWRDSYKRIREFIEQYLTNFGINEATKSKSWYEIDFWLSGLIYCNLFNDKTINPYKSNRNLFDDIKAEFESYKNLKVAIENYEKTNLMELELEEIYNKAEFKILKDIYEKEKNNIFDLFSKRNNLKLELSKSINAKVGQFKELQKKIESEYTDTIEKTKKLIEEINNKKQNDKSIQEVTEPLLYLTKLMQLKQERKNLQDNIKKQLEKNTINESRLNSQIRFLNYKINRHILYIAERKSNNISTSEYVIKKSIEIYGRYVQE
jgi:hypothetical protein